MFFFLINLFASFSTIKKKKLNSGDNKRAEKFINLIHVSNKLIITFFVIKGVILSLSTDL